VTAVEDKIVGTRFTIQFSRTDPAHLQVAEILNRQGRRSKAQYIVNAVLCYENGGKSSKAQRSAVLDEKVIEAVVYRILRDRDEHDIGKPAADASSRRKPQIPPQSSEEISFDDALETLGQDGVDAVAGMLDMFKRK
jgi:hypothetical protein